MNEISCTNLDVASFLLVCGYTIQRLEQNGKTIAFVFDDPKNTAKLAIAEYYRDCPVGAKSLIAAMKQARDMMFEQKRQNSGKGYSENEQAYRLAAR